MPPTYLNLFCINFGVFNVISDKVYGSLKSGMYILSAQCQIKNHKVIITVFSMNLVTRPFRLFKGRGILKTWLIRNMGVLRTFAAIIVDPRASEMTRLGDRSEGQLILPVRELQEKYK